MTGEHSKNAAKDSGEAVIVAGAGAVSPAGWGVPALLAALGTNALLPLKEVAWPGQSRSLRFRPVPPPNPRPAWLGHARLRRACPVSWYGCGAALEALGPDAARVKELGDRFAILFCVMSGSMSYSRRFFDEVLANPGLASPLIFPETVFNAAASHLSALLETTAVNYTLVADAGGFVQALAQAGEWLASGVRDACLVVAAEENDWSLSCGFWQYAHDLVLAEGAGALYLKRGVRAGQVCLDAVTQSYPFTHRRSPLDAARAVRADLPAGGAAELLCDGFQSRPKVDRAERLVWQDWPGARLSPKTVLGEGLAAASAWQCVTAVEALKAGRHPAATVSVVGPNQQAVGARFVV